MPLVIKQQAGRSCPAIICDICGKEITDAKDGAYQWRANDEDDGEAFVYFVCKNGSCIPTFDRRNQEDCPGSEDLNYLIVYLINNLKVNIEKTKKEMMKMNDLGL